MGGASLARGAGAENQRGCGDTEMADEIDWLDLPGRWTYGVDRGGRIFFIKYVGLVLPPPIPHPHPVSTFSLKLSDLKGSRAGGQAGVGGGGRGWLTNKFIKIPV